MGAVVFVSSEMRAWHNENTLLTWVDVVKNFEIESKERLDTFVIRYWSNEHLTSW